MESLAGFVTYDHLASAELEHRGWRLEYVPWTRAEDWRRFCAVVIRSPWDYQSAPVRFLEVLRSIEAAGTPLANPVAVVEWNLRKTYLLELQAAGVTIIPTVVGEALTAEVIPRLARDLGDPEEIVIKPVVGANADGAFRLRAPFGDARAAEAAEHHARGSYLAQPFLPSILEEGEASLFYFRDRFSHAVRKRPKAGDFRVQEEHGGVITPVVPDAALSLAGERALGAIPRNLLYARIDLARLPSGAWAVMEVEVIEPSLYFDQDPQSPARFADALESWLANAAVETGRGRDGGGS